MTGKPNSPPFAGIATATALTEPGARRRFRWRPRRGAAATRLALVLCLALLPATAYGIERVLLETSSIEGAFGELHGVRVELTATRPSHLLIRAERLTLADGTTLDSLQLDCGDFLVDATWGLQCDDAILRLGVADSDPLTLQGRIGWQTDPARLRAELHTDGSDLALDLDWSGRDGGRLTVNATNLFVNDLLPHIPVLADWQADGLLSLDSTLELAADGGINSLDLRAELRALTAANASGEIATDGLDLDLDTRLRHQARRWDGRLSLRSLGGQAYVDPVFLDLDQQPLTAVANGVLSDGELRLEQGELHHTGLGRLRLNGVMQFANPAEHQLDLSFRDLSLDGAYTTYLQPFLIGGALDSLDAEGRLHADLRLLNGEPVRLFAELDDAMLRDQRERFHLHGVHASVVWPAGGPDQQSWLRWDDGGLYRLALGPSELRAQMRRDGLGLMDTWRLPVEDGRLVVRRLELAGLGSEQVLVDLDAELEPLSLNRLSRALGWPELGGRIGGRLPGLRYQDGEIIFDGALRAELFDGQVTIDGLRLRDPLGVLPTLQADATIRNLDLEQVTSTFEIGRITGRLHADIDDLMLENWQPARFNARLYTPEDDRSARRISQRAINTISSVSGGGGGATALLQRSALQFFDTFRYDRLALACELRDEICHMDGLEERDGGYVIIRGSGLPRIDVLGFNRRVSWPVLIEQLGAVMEQQEQNETE